MSDKRLFQVLDQMNLMDIENGSHLVSLHPDVLELNSTKKGVRVTMGVPHEALTVNGQMSGKKRVVLMVIDGDEYDKLITPTTKTKDNKVSNK